MKPSLSSEVVKDVWVLAEAPQPHISQLRQATGSIVVTRAALATPLKDVLEQRRGVCQDFAHLAIGCLRSIELAARYASGYLETMPSPGQPKLLGADASHAWVAAFVPGWGWLEFDPTNGTLPGEQHIVMGTRLCRCTPLPA